MLAATLPGLALVDPLPLFLFLALVAAARIWTLPMFDRASFAVSFVPTLAAGMVLGPVGASFGGLVSGIGHGIVRRLVWYKLLFNTGNYILGATVATLFFRAFGEKPLPENLPYVVALGAATGLVHYSHTLLTSAAIAAERRTPYRATFREHFGWLWPQYAVLGVMAALVAVAYCAFGVPGVAAFVAPPAMMIYVAKQYVHRTSEGVRQLRALNAELQTEIQQRATAEERNAELARQAARAAALEEANRVRTQFISVASHELRTPLTAIVGHGELLLADMPDADPRHAMAAAIVDSAREMTDLVEHMLDASRIEIGALRLQPAEVDLAALVANVLASFSPGAPHHELVASIAPDAASVRADPHRLRQVLTNLVGNAIKYSPDGGPVEVRTRRAAPDRVEILVADRGLGVPKNQRAHLFDPYRRVDDPQHRRIEGTGLGLYIVRSLAELHGGSVRVESEVGRGSTFVVSLPA